MAISPGMASLLSGVIGGGLQLAGGLMQGNAQNQQNTLAQNNSTAGAIAGYYNQLNQNQLARDQAGFAASQSNPLAVWDARANAATKADLVGQATPVSYNFDWNTGMGSYQGGLFNRPFSAQTQAMFSPQVRAASELQDFRAPLVQLNPNIPIPNLASLGYANTPALQAQQAQLETYRQQEGRKQLAQQLAQKNETMSAIQGTLTPQQGGQPPKGYEYKYNSKTGQYELVKKGGGFWSKFGKIAGMVAPFALAPFTGGLSLLASTALNAGIGAATGALGGGGWKGALLGGGMGALSGGLAGKIPGLSPKLASTAIPGIQTMVAPMAQQGVNALANQLVYQPQPQHYYMGGNQI